MVMMKVALLVLVISGIGECVHENENKDLGLTSTTWTIVGCAVALCLTITLTALFAAIYFKRSDKVVVHNASKTAVKPKVSRGNLTENLKEEKRRRSLSKGSSRSSSKNSRSSSKNSRSSSKTSLSSRSVDSSQTSSNSSQRSSRSSGKGAVTEQRIRELEKEFDAKLKSPSVAVVDETQPAEKKTSVQELKKSKSKERLPKRSKSKERFKRSRSKERLAKKSQSSEKLSTAADDQEPFSAILSPGVRVTHPSRAIQVDEQEDKKTSKKSSKKRKITQIEFKDGKK